MKKSKCWVPLIGTVVCMNLITGCNKNTTQLAGIESQNIKNDATNQDIQNKKIHIVCTTYAPYDWVNQLILGQDEFDVTLLMDEGVDLHSYQPTAEDIAKISDADLFIYVGGESDAWIDDALKNTTNASQKVINLMEVLEDKVKVEEIVEGMEHEHEEEHHHEHEEEEHHEEHEHEEEVEYDEHVWLSLKNAEVCVKEIEQAIEELDQSQKALCEENSKQYLERLNSLDQQYQDAVESAERKTILFGDRFPFRYLVDDYGIDYFAAFVGCSAESEASFETIAFLANKVEEMSLPGVLVLENSDQKIAKAIVNNTEDKNESIWVMDSLQSVTREEIEQGYSYLSAMNSNLEVLKKALNE